MPSTNSVLLSFHRYYNNLSFYFLFLFGVQVILQSETIQELTKTSQALAALQEEASELRKLADARGIEIVASTEQNFIKIVISNFPTIIADS